jgi:hypothetical protein
VLLVDGIEYVEGIRSGGKKSSDIYPTGIKDGADRP